MEKTMGTKTTNTRQGSQHLAHIYRETLPSPKLATHSNAFHSLTYHGDIFTTSRVTKVIQKLQHRKSMDHTGLWAEHVICAQEFLAPFLTLIFNRSLAEGFLPQWTMSTVAPIHKGGDPMNPNTYRTIMIGHTLAKLYGQYWKQSFAIIWRP